MDQRPLITDIRHFALDDGPGIRTTVFLKGCSLVCVWCQNPEAGCPDPQIAFHARACIRCGQCAAVCPRGAARLDREDRIVRDRCMACGRCAAACPSRALRTVGRHYPAGELVEILTGDRVFYETSAGGVTFSGGEPTLHLDYLSQVAAALKRQGIHVALQTAGTFDYAEFSTKLLPFIDLIFYDLKLSDPHDHLKYTGQRNKRILRNLEALSTQSSATLIVTIPLVPGITATETNLAGIARILEGAGLSRYELRPYHPGGNAKRRIFGQPIPAGSPAEPLGQQGEAQARAVLERNREAIKTGDARGNV